MKHTRRSLFSTALSSLAGVWAITTQWGLVATLLPGCRDNAGTTPTPDDEAQADPKEEDVSPSAAGHADEPPPVDSAPAEPTASAAVDGGATNSAPPNTGASPTNQRPRVKPKYGGPPRPPITTKYGGPARKYGGPSPPKYGGPNRCGCAPSDLMCAMKCNQK